MALFTTYLAHLKGVDLSDRGLKNPKIYYVMRNRGNNDVAPSAELLGSMLAKVDRWSKTHNMPKEVGRKAFWNEYRSKYLKEIRCLEAISWMRKVADEAMGQDIVLVCFEKDYGHCHRMLLAQTITTNFPEVNYVGELRLDKPSIVK